MKKIGAPYLAAAVATGIAGTLHLMMTVGSLGFNVNQGVLFTVGGIAQVFWIIPMVRRWGGIWYLIGIAGTVAFLALFFITRMPGNPITGRGAPAGNPIAITIEVCQGIFVCLAAAILVRESREKRKQPRTETLAAQPATRTARRSVPILAGIVLALVLAGLFVLPMTMHRPTGGPGGLPPSGQQQSDGQRPQAGSPAQTGASTNQTCTLTPSLLEIEGTPQQTEGPYFVDGMPNRSYIISDTSDGSVQQGVPLTLVINVYDMDNGHCIPLNGTRVDIWHANYQGVYSGIQQQGTVGKDFLRGYQMTNDNGTVRFTTVYPGWYEGRAIHIHVKIRTFDGLEKTFEWTSQFYLANSVNELVHTQFPYSSHGPVGTTNEGDGIYTGPSTDGLISSNTGKHLMLNLTKEDQGYLGTFNVVIQTSKAL